MVEPWQDRRVQPIAALAIGCAQRAVIARAKHAHRGVLEPAALNVRRHQGDVRRVGLGQALRERLGDCARCEILILREDRPLRRCDRVEIEMPDFAHCRPPVEYRLRARDRYVDVREVGFNVAGPHVIDGRLYYAPRRTPGHPSPTLPRELAQCTRTIAADDDADVVERRVRLASVIDAARIIVRVGGRVPARAREVVAADEGHCVVDDDDLLVVTCAGGMAVVEAKRQPPMRPPVELVDRQPFALHRIEHREVPRQDVTADSAAPRDDGIKEVAQRFRKSIASAPWHKLHPAIDVPPNDEKRAACPSQGVAHRGEIGFAVDQKRRTIGALDPPAVTPGYQKWRTRFW